MRRLCPTATALWTPLFERVRTVGGRTRCGLRSNPACGHRALVRISLDGIPPHPTAVRASAEAPLDEDRALRVRGDPPFQLKDPIGELQLSKDWVGCSQVDLGTTARYFRKREGRPECPTIPTTSCHQFRRGASSRVLTDVRGTHARCRRPCQAISAYTVKSDWAIANALTFSSSPI